MDLKKKRVLDWGRAVDATERGSSNWGHSHLHPKANAGLFRSGEQAGIMVARNYEEYVRDGKRGRRANGDRHITERRRNLWGSKVQEDDYGWHQLIAHIKLPIMNVPKSKNLNISVVGQFSWLFNHYTLHYKYWNGMLCHLKIYTIMSQLKMKSLFPKLAFRVLEALGQFSASLSYKLGEPIWVIPILVSAEYNYGKKERGIQWWHGNAGCHLTQEMPKPETAKLSFESFSPHPTWPSKLPDRGVHDFLLLIPEKAFSSRISRKVPLLLLDWSSLVILEFRKLKAGRKSLSDNFCFSSH